MLVWNQWPRLFRKCEGAITGMEKEPWLPLLSRLIDQAMAADGNTGYAVSSLSPTSRSSLASISIDDTISVSNSGFSGNTSPFLAVDVPVKSSPNGVPHGEFARAFGE